MSRYCWKACTLGAIFCLALPSVALAQQRPELFPNEHLKKVGQTQANADIGVCEGQARERFGRSTQSSQAGRRGVRGAARGAAAGALVGTITDQNVGRSVGAGAAVGGAAGVARGARQRGQMDPQYQKWVEACLEDKGYRVVGWK